MDTQYKWHKWDGGLWLTGPKESGPPNTVRRAKGVHKLYANSLRSRRGHTQYIGSLAGSIHSLYRFNGRKVWGIGTNFFIDTILTNAGLSGNRLSFNVVSPTTGAIAAGIQSYLFVLDGTAPFKVDPAGVTTVLGITAPATNPTLASGGAGNLTGTYKYAVTFLNTVTGTRSNANPTIGSITLTANQTSLTAIPTSADAQVNAREIYRTVGNGAVLFLLTTINDNSTTTLTDNTTDVNLKSQQLQIDNNPVTAFADVTDMAGPYAGRMWYSRRSGSGNKGRLYYSPVGRAEDISGFVDVSDDNDPTQKVFYWSGSIWQMTQQKLFQIVGTDEPFLAREVYGVVGTVSPRMLVTTPYGVLYLANDGVRIFDGSVSRLVGFPPMEQLFSGEGPESLPVFVSLQAFYARGEYIMLGDSYSLALNLEHDTWRMPTGQEQVVTAGYYAPEVDDILAGVTRSGGFNLVSFESILFPSSTDFGTGVSWEIETVGIMMDAQQRGLPALFTVDMNPSGQTITPTLVMDGSATALAPNISGSQRVRVDFPIGSLGNVVGLRLTGTVSQAVELFEIALTVHVG